MVFERFSRVEDRDVGRGRRNSLTDHRVYAGTLITMPAGEGTESAILFWFCCVRFQKVIYLRFIKIGGSIFDRNVKDGAVLVHKSIGWVAPQNVHAFLK